MILHEFEKAKIWTQLESMEDGAIAQVKDAMTHPRLFKHLAIMPDVHQGIGCTIGSVIPIEDAVIPSAVGADIGCGMCSIETSLTKEEITPQFDNLNRGILHRIPTGFSHRSQQNMKDVEKYLELERLVFTDAIEQINKKYPRNDIKPQLGTLGGGNHFIELQIDEKDKVWIMIHSGSRNIGNQISSKYISLAKTIADPKEPVPKDMEYLPLHNSHAKDYIDDMNFAVLFAFHSRALMMECIKDELKYRFPDVKFEEMINISHNYVAMENHFGKDIMVHRKGATRAVSDELGIIPGSMGTASYIVKGKNNLDSFTSCSHGAGRLMSRSKARGKFNRRKKEFKSEGVLKIEDFKSDMEGVYSKSIDRFHLDEAPRAYKNIDTIMANQTDLVDIVVKLKPIFNIKG